MQSLRDRSLEPDLIYAGSRKTITIEISAHEAGVGLSNATLLNASSGQEDLLLLPAGAQNFSSEGASSTPPSPLVPYVM